jgi:outer membrane protein OmpA-like peptidoglycan-associated protein
MRKHVAGGLVAVATMISAAGCVTIGSAQPPPDGDCPWATASDTSQQPPSSDTVVLVDNTASFWPKAGQPSRMPDDPVPATVNALLQDFDSAGTRLVSFATFDGSSATIDWRITRAALPPATGDDNEIKGEKSTAGACLKNTVKSAVGTAPQSPGTDVMAALAAAGQQLQGSPASSDHIVLVTDGLSNTGCLSLSTAISQGKAASAVLGTCPERLELAQLHGVSLSLVGIGFQAGQPLSTAEQALVENYWGGMCAALGVKSPASCVAPPEGSAPRASTVARMADPGIVFRIIPPHGQVPAVPADLLFGFDSSALSAVGRAYLGVLAQQVKAQRRTILKVIGYTDAVGSISYNLDLSQKRAKAVVDYLATVGFSHVTANGAGKADPVCSPQYTAAGAPIQSCMAKNRRVQIILGG